MIFRISCAIINWFNKMLQLKRLSFEQFNKENLTRRNQMANIKSAKKRVLIERERRVANNSVKSEIKTYIKKFKSELTEDVAKAEETYRVLVAKLDSASRENVIHQNSANRKKAHFAKLLDNAKKSK